MPVRVALASDRPLAHARGSVTLSSGRRLYLEIRQLGRSAAGLCQTKSQWKKRSLQKLTTPV